ncbi:MAG: ComF family protein [bacterium]|nr:ComF family protein [bacterium]
MIRALRSRVVKKVLRVLDTVTEYWLGSSSPPPERAFELVGPTGWRPDRPDAYCGRCGESVGAGERTVDGGGGYDDGGCASCRGARQLTTAFVRLGAYEGPLREWVLGIKYGCRWTEMAETLGRALGQAVRAGGHVQPSRVIVVPMPMPWLRRLHRGIDHAGVLAWGVSRALEAPLVPALARSGGRTQASLPASERARSGGAGLRVRWRWARAAARRSRNPWWGRHVVLVDDVRTTGASMRSAARLLGRLGPARIIAAVVAVADDPARRGRGEIPDRPRGGRDTRSSEPVLSRLTRQCG